MKIIIALCACLAFAAGDVSHLPTTEYLPPSHQHAASANSVSFSAAPAPSVDYAAPESYHVEAASAPAVSYESTSYETDASEPAHSYSSAEGYRYKTAKRRVYRRHRRDVSHLSSDYLPPAAASNSIEQYESAPTYTAAGSEPASAYETVSYETAPSEPAHSFSAADGYRYRTVKRRVIRRQRRDVSHLSNDYLPPHQGAASATSVEYLPPAASAPAVQYQSAPTYSVAASGPAVQYQSAPTYSIAASAPAVHYQSAPTYSVAASAPAVQYQSAPTYSVAASAPAASYETASYDVSASAPAHSYSSAEGYRYKTAKRRVIRRRRF